MFAIHIRVEYRGMAILLAPTLAAGANWAQGGQQGSGRNKASQTLGGFRAEANNRTVLYWHARMLPRHFSAANARYNYSSRKQKYLEIKRELAQTGRAFVNGQLITDKVRKGGTVDIVRSSITEVLARGPSPVNATANKATLRMTVPAAIAARPRSDRPDMSKEITITTMDERNELRDVWMQEFNRQLVGFNRTLTQGI